MQWRAHVTSIALTVAAAAALAYAYLDRGSVTESEKKNREGSVFVAWRREDLARIVIDHGPERIALDRVKDDAGEPEWWMRAPLAERANGEACDRLASAFELAAVIRKVAPDVQVPGLDAPRARGEIGMGSVTHRFTLGGDAPTPEGAAYLRVEGVGTVVVSRDLVTALLQGSDTYRSRAFVPYVSVNLSALEVAHDGAPAVRIARGDDVSFTLLPSGLRASRSKLDAIWGALGEMRAEAFLSDDAAAPLVATPQTTITMTPMAKGAVPGVIRVGGACPANPEDVVVVRDAPTRLSACAPKGILSGLATTDAELVDEHLFASHDDEVAELRTETLPSGPALDLARKENGWTERAPASGDLLPDEVTAAGALVTAITRAEGTGARKDDAPFEARWRVTLRRAEGGATEVVELGAPDGAGDVVARRAFDGARLHVAAAVARVLTPRAVALRGLELWSPRVEGAPVAAIETRCDGVSQTLTRDDGAWEMREPAGFAPDNASVLALIDTVTRARVESWVADADDGHFGFDAASPCFVALTLRTDGGGRVARVELGREGEGGFYARTGSSPAVFVAPAALRDAARSLLVDLHGFALPNVDSVTLARDGKRLTYAADAGTDEATEAVIGAAAVLRADSVVHLGAARAAEGLGTPSLVLVLRAGAVSRRVVFGGEVAGEKARYARVDGIDATYTVDRERIRAFYERF